LYERRVARRRGAWEEECEPNPKPRSKPKPSSADVAERGVASIGVRSSRNLCVDEEYAYGEADAHSTTPTYTTGKDSPAREASWSAFWVQKPSILRVCVREEDAGGREAGAPSDLKMPLENGCADERVSRGQASERAVCVC
jgi:hypothetical protein